MYSTEKKKTTLISLHAHAARGDCALLFIYKLENLQALKLLYGILKMLYNNKSILSMVK